MPAPRLDMIGIVSEDIAASLAFYRLLGLDVPTTADGPHVEITLVGGMRLAWDSADLMRALDPARPHGPAGPGVALAFLCASPAEVDAVYARMDAAGHGHRAPWDAPWGQRYAMLRDPDGTPVDLFAPR